VASRDPDKAKRFADRFGCDPTSYDGLLKRDDVDAVYVSLPTAMHTPFGEEVLRSGKHLLLEKPVGTNAAEARRLLALAGELGLVVRENLTSVRHSQHARVRELIQAGRLGAVRSMSAAFCIPPLRAHDIRYVAALGGGALLDVGVYPIRLAQLMLGDDIRVVGSTLRLDPTLGVDLAGQALVVSPDGVLAHLEFGFEHTYGSTYSLWGSKGRLELDRAFTPQASWQPVLKLSGQDHAEQIVLPADDQFLRSVESLAAAILARRAPGAAAVDAADDGTEGRRIVRTLEIVDEVRRQAVCVFTEQH